MGGVPARLDGRPPLLGLGMGPGINGPVPLSSVNTTTQENIMGRAPAPSAFRKGGPVKAAAKPKAAPVKKKAGGMIAKPKAAAAAKPKGKAMPAFKKGGVVKAKGKR